MWARYPFSDHLVDYDGFGASNSGGGNVTKYIPHTASELISPRKLTFDEMIVVRRVVAYRSTLRNAVIRLAPNMVVHSQCWSGQ